MEYSKEDKKKYLIFQCRYYKGETEPPRSLPEGYALMWDYEMRWVEWNLNQDKMLIHFDEDIRTLHLETKEGDKTPLTLKALLCNRYLHWGGYKPLDEELQDFEKWHVDFYQLWKTNREQRAEKRRPGLIGKCHYYKGEEDNPWRNTDGRVNLLRARHWDLEKQWVEELSFSYHSELRECRFLEYKNAKKCFMNRETPVSLINHILGWHFHSDSSGDPTIDDLETCYKDIYLKYKPLGSDVSLYYRYYMGEKENPFSPDDNNRNGLFWFWEQMTFQHIKDPKKSHYRDFLPEDLHKCEEPWLNNERIPIDQKALSFFIYQMSLQWLPYNNATEMIKDYFEGIK